MHDVETIGSQPAQTALDTFQKRSLRPIRPTLNAVRMTALCKKIIIIATITNGVPDHFFAVAVALAGVDDVKSGIERAAQEGVDGLLVGFFKTNLRRAKTKNRNTHVGLAELAQLHTWFL
jgi:hypothetical protein